MIKQKYIDILSKQKEDLLKIKSGLGFWKRFTYRWYTDWVITDEVKDYCSQTYCVEPGFPTDTGVPIGKPKYYSKQVFLRM